MEAERAFALLPNVLPAFVHCHTNSPVWLRVDRSDGIKVLCSGSDLTRASLLFRRRLWRLVPMIRSRVRRRAEEVRAWEREELVLREELVHRTAAGRQEKRREAVEPFSPSKGTRLSAR